MVMTMEDLRRPGASTSSDIDDPDAKPLGPVHPGRDPVGDWMERAGAQRQRAGASA